MQEHRTRPLASRHVTPGPRMYCAEGLAQGAIVTLSEAAQRHLAALRLQRGDAIVLFSGDGYEYSAELVELSKRNAAAKIQEPREVDRESPIAITLVQGICAADRMDLLVQKATELGVRAIQPVISTRTVIRLSSDRQERRAQHWENVAIAACEQCGRNRLPEMRPSIKFDEWIATGPSADARILLSPYGDKRLADLPRGESAIIAIGPEGGLTEDEHNLAESRGFTPIRFGPRILRTETAPLAVIAALQALWGDC
ncbi:MAG: 16S rRNA (uracil(1498)-N(3))-methyltransferase [Burkholderiales bacterium]